MEEKQQHFLIRSLYPLVARAGRSSISLLTSVRVFAPRPISSRLQSVQRLLERTFPKEPHKQRTGNGEQGTA